MLLTRAFGDLRLTPTGFLIAPGGRIIHQKIDELDRIVLRDTPIHLLDVQVRLNLSRRGL
jgi:hypothetical protein